MDNNEITKQLQDIHQKLDFLTEQMKLQQQKQREMKELKNDLTLIGKDVFDSAVKELEDVAPYFDTQDLIYLLKKILRNTRNLNKLFSQMESASDFFTDLKPLGKHMFDELMDNLHEMDKKGYFEFFNESIKIIDTVITSFDTNDVKLLRENITTILLTVKSLTQPDMLSSVNNAVGFFKKMDVEVKSDVSYYALIKQLRDPEVKRGISFMLEFVKNMAGSENNKQIKS